MAEITVSEFEQTILTTMEYSSESGLLDGEVNFPSFTDFDKLKAGVEEVAKALKDTLGEIEGGWMNAIKAAAIYVNDNTRECSITWMMNEELDEDDQVILFEILSEIASAAVEAYNLDNGLLANLIY